MEICILMIILRKLFSLGGEQYDSVETAVSLHQRHYSLLQTSKTKWPTAGYSHQENLVFSSYLHHFSTYFYGNAKKFYLSN